jgi:hypothetical protein
MTHSESLPDRPRSPLMAFNTSKARRRPPKRPNAIPEPPASRAHRAPIRGFQGVSGGGFVSPTEREKRVAPRASIEGYFHLPTRKAEGKKPQLSRPPHKPARSPLMRANASGARPPKRPDAPQSFPASRAHRAPIRSF